MIWSLGPTLYRTKDDGTLAKTDDSLVGLSQAYEQLTGSLPTLRLQYLRHEHPNLSW